MRDGNGQNRTLHAGEQHRVRPRDAHQGETSLVLLGPVAHETRPRGSPGDQVLERRQHLTTIAHAQGKVRIVLEESRELLACARVEQDRLRPPLPGTQNVAVGKAAAGYQALKARQTYAP